MPFGPAFAPSLGLSLLQAELTRHGIPSSIFYPSIQFAETIGQHFYSGIAVESRPPMPELAGEWIFSAALFNRPLRDDDPYVEEVLRGRASAIHRFAARPISDALIRRLVEARHRVPAFLDATARQILENRPRVVGFTSVFQQHTASLAMARRLKEASPEMTIIFGGANCEGVMGAETVRQFSFVDAAVSGEGELVFPDLVRRALNGEALEGLDGVRTRGSIAADFAAGRFGSAPPVRDMDALPPPDYRDYMRQFGASRLSRSWLPTLYFETSRGCWWGERQHCTFCGLNGATMAFRSKSAARAVGELETLVSSYPECDIQVSDNILDLQYFKDVLPELARRRLGARLFYETKANLRRDQVRLLRDAGVLTIQPGIESLSDEVLKLMKKGVSGLQNIQLLKWCKELGVSVLWNVLWGFPGEPASAYARMTALVPHLVHLPPPAGFAGLRLDRFSPNFVNAEALGFADVRPIVPYRHIYDFPEPVLANLAYSFTYRYRDERDVERYVRPLMAALARWQQEHAGSDLFSMPAGDRLVIWDLRPRSRAPLTVLDGVDRILYEACDQISDVDRLAAMLRDRGHGLTADEIAGRLAPLIHRGLMLKDGGRHLALAIPIGEYVPADDVLRRFDAVVGDLGRRTPSGIAIDPAVVRVRRGGSRRTVTLRRSFRPRAMPQVAIDDRGQLLVTPVSRRPA